MNSTRRPAVIPARVRAAADAARRAWDWGADHGGTRLHQRCPRCRSRVYATSPPEPAVHGWPDETTYRAAIAQFNREVTDRLDDAVADHLHHDCPDAHPRPEDRP